MYLFITILRPIVKFHLSLDFDNHPMKKPTFSLNRKDPDLQELVEASDKRSLAFWALACAERVLPYFESEFPQDSRPRQALGTLQDWIDTGEFSMKIIRGAALASHAAAREVGEDNPARSAARAAGQAISTAHVKAHALAAANCALQAIFRANFASNPEAAIQAERKWQTQRLLELYQQESLDINQE
jgi:hypothetical protein